MYKKKKKKKNQSVRITCPKSSVFDHLRFPGYISHGMRFELRIDVVISSITISEGSHYFNLEEE